MTTSRTNREAGEIEIALNEIPDSPFVFACCGTIRMCQEARYHCEKCRRVSAYIVSSKETGSVGAYWTQKKNFIFVLSEPTEELNGTHSMEIMVMGITKEKRIYKKDQRLKEIP